MSDKQSDLILSVEDIPEEQTSTNMVPMPVDTSLSPIDRLISMALQAGDVDKLDRVLALRKQEEERAFKQAFDAHFGEMQAKLKPITRNKQGDKGKYPPLEDMQKQCNPTIFEHGFSYYWSEETLPENCLRVVLHVSGYGYTKTNYKDLPFYEPDKGNSSGKAIMNPLQAEGTRASYGRRYSFIAGFGLVLQDEDTDGTFEFEEGVRYADYIHQMDQAPDAVALHTLLTDFATSLREAGDKDGIKFLTKYYTHKKQEFAK